MGRFRGAVPNDDPERLSRVLDEKLRMFGVDKAALDRQVQERRAREAQEAADLRTFAQKAAQMDGALCAAHQAGERQRREVGRGVDAFRHAQAEERCQREAEQRQAELAASRAEQEAHLSSPWLNEDPALGRSAVSPNRVRRDHWKGMSEEQLRGIRDIQASQVAAKAQQAQQERAEQRAYDGMQAGFANTLARKAAEAEAAKRTEAGRLVAELQRQVLEKRERDAHLSKLYTNPPASGYFAQFGTSHR